MTREPTYDQPPVPWDGAVDGDGHVLEPPEVWTEYLEMRFRERGPRLLRNDAGWEYFAWEGGGSNPGAPGMLGTMGDTSAVPGPDRGYVEFTPFGAADPGERLALLDKEHLDGAVLYPTIGLMWERDVADPELALALARAYNRWLADFCRDGDGRLVAIAHLPLIDPAGAAAELERAVADGCRGAFVATFTHARRSFGDPMFDPVWAAAQDLGVPVAIHPLFEPPSVSPLTRFDDLAEPGVTYSFFWNVTTRQRVEQAFLSFFAGHVFDRFPRFTIGVLESGAGWIGSLLDRMDHIEPAYASARRPSEIFREQCFISGDPDETALPLVIDHVGADRFLWASDYPHPDHQPTYVEAVTRLVSGLSDETRSAVLGGNAKRLYSLT